MNVLGVYKFDFRRLRASAACLGVLSLLAGTPLVAAPISGVVTNQTDRKPAAGDTVALIRLTQGMQVAAQTTTDAAGSYTLNIADPDPMHLVRVTHQGANYFQAAPPGRTTVNVEVYNAAEQVTGISTEADVERMETDQNGLRITENFFVKNASSPPVTQIGQRAYPIFLPKDAQIVSSAALGPGSMPVQSSPVPIGPAGAYAFAFPLRPGETRFQVAYRLPYTGSVEFQPRVATVVDNFALILPKSMHFEATPAASFQPIDEDPSVQTYLTKNLTPSTHLTYHISGSGQLPQQSSQPDSGSAGAPQAGAQGAAGAGPESSAAAGNRPGIGLGNPIDTPDPLHKYKWWILSAAAILLAVGAGLSMRPAGAPSSAAVTAEPPTEKATVPADVRLGLLHVLKEELFALETDRLEGRIAPAEYERQKMALEVVLQRALARDGGAVAKA